MATRQVTSGLGLAQKRVFEGFIAIARKLLQILGMVGLIAMLAVAFYATSEHGSCGKIVSPYIAKTQEECRAGDSFSGPALDEAASVSGLASPRSD